MSGSCNTEYFLWLSEICYAGSSLPKRLYLSFNGDMRKIYETPGEAFSAIGCTAEECRRLSDKDFSAANRILDYCAENRVTILTYDSPLYPDRLFMTDNPPPVLYAKGAVNRLREGPSVTAAGSRGCSEKGYRDMYTLCYKIAGAGAAVITGLADGIDHAASLAALDSGGLSIGVLGSGINILYPFGNEDFFDRMMKNGVILTEFSPFTEPLARNFPIRNRVLSALCDVCLVGEARGGSDALITAKNAFLSGKTVYAVPAGIYDLRCDGTNFLLRNGAIPVTKAEDVLDGLSFLYPEEVNLKKRTVRSVPDMPPPKQTRRKRAKNEEHRVPLPFDPEEVAKLPPRGAKGKAAAAEPRKEESDRERFAHFTFSSRCEEERKILYLLKSGDKTVDMLANRCAMDAADVLTYLTILEIDGYVTALPGGAYRLGKD